MTKFSLPQWVMCPPQYYGVKYIINPWMEGNIGRVRHEQAQKQWERLLSLLSKYSKVQLIPPEHNLPDMTFTANAGLVYGKTFVPASFNFKERRGEEAYYLDWFTNRGYRAVPLPIQAPFEGEGDALFQPGERLLWAGYGIRTALATHQCLADIFNVEVISLKLIDPHFYHLDTCFAALPDGRVIYFPPAFDAESLKILEAKVPADKRLVVSKADADNFVCNGIIMDNLYICNKASDIFCKELKAWNFTVVQTPLTEFMLAGGAAKCLVLGLAQTMPSAPAKIINPMHQQTTTTS